MKAKFDKSILGIFFMLLFMACTTAKTARAQYPQNDDNNYQNNDNSYQGNDYSNNDAAGYDDQPSEADVNMDVFVNDLSPYGRWVNSPSYGRVWICNENGFTPYNTGGHWVFTNYGWTWASDYSWGWAPFHYGRWANDPYYGWMWVPGYEWGPAWVGWRTGGDYYGWAPLSPGINISIGFSYNNIPANNWCFVPRRYIGYGNFNRYAVNRSRNITIIHNTTIINNTNIYRNTRYVTGPNRIDVERATGTRINEVRVQNDNRPGPSRVVNNNTINIYRPQANNQNRSRRIDANPSVSHDGNTPSQSPRVIRMPENRDNNVNGNDNTRQPDPRDRVNNNSNSDNNRVDINHDRSNVPDNRNTAPQQNNQGQSNNQNNNYTPPQQNNRVPDYNNRRNMNNVPQQNNRVPDYRNNNRQFPNYNNGGNNNGRNWQPAPQQPRNIPSTPAPVPQQPRKKPGKPN